MSLTHSFYTIVASLLIAQNTFANSAQNAATRFGLDKPDDLVGGSNANPYDAITGVVIGLLSLVTIVAVGYVLYAGFQILSAGGDEEKVKTGRKTIINVLIGIVVMWLAYWIVSLVVKALV